MILTFARTMTWRAAFLLAFSALLTAPILAQSTSIDVDVQFFSDFEPRHSDKRDFGPLVFRQGAVLSSRSRDFGGLSGLHLFQGGTKMIAVSDTGLWFTADVVRDDRGFFSDIQNVEHTKLFSGYGPASGPKYYTDAEGLDVVGERAFISYESTNVVSEYAMGEADFQKNPKILDLPTVIDNLGVNKGLEALAIAPQASPLAGSFVIMVEKGITASGDANGWIIPLSGTKDENTRFTLKRHDRFDITDAAFLKNGDLLIVERRFTIATGVGMRLRRVAAHELKPGAVIDPELLFEAGLAHRIDNMEGISVFETVQGETVVAILADDNQSLLQRTIYLEFTLPQ